MLMALRGLLLFLGCWCWPLLAAEAAPRIVLVYNGGQDVFQQFVDALTPPLQRSGVSIGHHDIRNWPAGTGPDHLARAALVIAVGSDSTALLARQPPATAVLCVLLSRAQFEQHAAALRSRATALSAIYQDPPQRRQLQLAQLLLPRFNRVGYLYQPSEAAELPALQQVADALHLKLIAQPVAADAELPPALVSVIRQSDFLLANANAALYNRYTIKTILTTAYRQEKVLIGSSPAFVKAGSLASTYSSVAHIALQVQEWLASQPATGAIRLPPASYARHFDLSINADVARSLGIALPDNETLLKTLQEQARADARSGVDHD